MTKLRNNSSIDGLVDLACRDGVDVRPTLLRVLTDLYVQKPTHSDVETTQYVELALGLIDAVDEQTRAAVSHSLSDYPAAPVAVLNKLASLRSPPVDDLTLPLPFDLPPVASPPLAPGDKAQAGRDAEGDDLADLFFSAGSEDRRLILLNLDVIGQPPARIAGSASAESVRLLEMVALKQNAGAFAETLARALGIPRGLAERIVGDASGEPIVIAARSLGMKAAVLQRILLFINPAVGQSVQRVFDLADLFEELSPTAADRMVAIWRTAAPPAARKPSYQPIYQDDTARSVRTSSGHDERPTAERIDRPSPVRSTG